MYESSWIWLIIALLFMLAETGHPGLFFFLSFALGAGITAVFALAVSSFQAQLALFLVSTIVSMYGLKKWLSFSKIGEKGTNVAALLGRRVLVTTDITPDSPGAVKFDGTIWTAHSYQETFLKGDRVTIHAVKGAHVVVKSVAKNIF